MEALRPVLGDAMVARVKVAEITDIMVSMSTKETEEKESQEEDALTKAKEAANVRMKERDAIAQGLKEAEQKKTEERTRRREERKKKKEASLAKKERAAEKRILDDAKRLKEEVRETGHSDLLFKQD